MSINEMTKREIDKVIREWTTNIHHKNILTKNLNTANRITVPRDWFPLCCEHLGFDKDNVAKMLDESLNQEEPNELVLRAFEQLVFCAKMVSETPKVTVTDDYDILAAMQNQLTGANTSLVDLEKKIRAIVSNLYSMGELDLLLSDGRLPAIIKGKEDSVPVADLVALLKVYMTTLVIRSKNKTDKPVVLGTHQEN